VSRAFWILGGVAVFLVVVLVVGVFIPVHEVRRDNSKTDEAVTKVDCSRDGSILTVDGKRYAVTKAARVKHPELTDYRERKDHAVLDGLVPVLCGK
jgi:hypothetical protein